MINIVIVMFRQNRQDRRFRLSAKTKACSCIQPVHFISRFPSDDEVLTIQSANKRDRRDENKQT